MQLDDYLKRSAADFSARTLARALGVSDVMVSQWRSGLKFPAPAMCVRVEIATHEQVRRWDLRPHDWWAIWPELVDQDGAPTVPPEAPKAVAA